MRMAKCAAAVSCVCRRSRCHFVRKLFSQACSHAFGGLGATRRPNISGVVGVGVAACACVSQAYTSRAGKKLLALASLLLQRDASGAFRRYQASLEPVNTRRDVGCARAYSEVLNQRHLSAIVKLLWKVGDGCQCVDVTCVWYVGQQRGEARKRRRSVSLRRVHHVTVFLSQRRGSESSTQCACARCQRRARHRY
jgi:hypothetical protein